MYKWIYAITIIIFCSLVGYCIYLQHKLNQTTQTPKIELVDSINTVIDTIYIKNDSLLNSVKESKVIINNIENDYKKDYIRIVNESSSDDWLFFTEYLQKQESRGLFNCDYSNSAETD